MRPVRCSARVSSRIARRDTTILPRRRSIFRIWNGCGTSISGLDVADRPDVDLAARKEGDGAAEIDGEAALHPAEDHALDAVAGGEFALELVPGGFAARAVARQHRFAGRILDPVDVDLDLVADLHVGLLARRGELAQRDPALALQADVDDGHVILDARDLARHHLAFEGFVLAAEAFVEEGREIVAGRECGCRHGCMCSFVFKLACRVAATMAGLHMRTWLHALPRRAPCRRGVLGACEQSRRAPAIRKSACRCRFIRCTVRARQRRASASDRKRPPDGRALSLEDAWRASCERIAALCAPELWAGECSRAGRIST